MWNKLWHWPRFCGYSPDSPLSLVPWTYTQASDKWFLSRGVHQKTEQPKCKLLPVAKRWCGTGRGRGKTFHGQTQEGSWFKSTNKTKASSRVALTTSYMNAQIFQHTCTSVTNWKISILIKSHRHHQYWKTEPHPHLHFSKGWAVFS